MLYCIACNVFKFIIKSSYNFNKTNFNLIQLVSFMLSKSNSNATNGNQ